MNLFLHSQRLPAYVFKYYGFVIQFEIRGNDDSALFFLKIALIIWGLGGSIQILGFFLLFL